MRSERLIDFCIVLIISVCAGSSIRGGLVDGKSVRAMGDRQDGREDERVSVRCAYKVDAIVLFTINNIAIQVTLNEKRREKQLDDDFHFKSSSAFLDWLEEWPVSPLQAIHQLYYHCSINSLCNSITMMMLATSTLRSTPRLAAFAARRAASTTANASATAQQAKDKASDVAEQAKDKASSAAEQAKDKASDVADKAKQQASSAADSAKGYLNQASASGSKILGQIEERAGGLLGCKHDTLSPYYTILHYC